MSDFKAENMLSVDALEGSNGCDSSIEESSSKNHSGSPEKPSVNILEVSSPVNNMLEDQLTMNRGTSILLRSSILASRFRQHGKLLARRSNSVCSMADQHHLFGEAWWQVSDRPRLQCLWQKWHHCRYSHCVARSCINQSQRSGCWSTIQMVGSICTFE